MTRSPLRPAGTRALRLEGAVFAALRDERRGSGDDDAIFRALADRAGIDELALVEWERWSQLGRHEGDARFALLLACLVTGERVASGSSVAPIGQGPRFTPFFEELARLGAPVDEPRIVQGLNLLTADLSTRPAHLRVVGRLEERRPLVLEAGTLTFHGLASAEATVARRLVDLFALPPPSYDDAAIARALIEVIVRAPLRSTSGPMALAPAQARAVGAAVSTSFSVIAGGPGTGKTAIVANCVRAFAHLGVLPSEIALAAPTGRAAARLEESVHGALRSLDTPSTSDHALRERPPRAQTVHRMLGARHDGSFAHGPDAPLSARVVIVDEASMVSLPLFAALLDAIPRAQPVHLVLVGDAHQLPSVEAGDVLSTLTGARGSIARTLGERLVRVARLAKERGTPLEIDDADARPVDDGAVDGRVIWLDVVHRQASDVGGRSISVLAEHVRSSRIDEAIATVVVQDDPRALGDAGVELLPWGGDVAILAQGVARIAALHALSDDERDLLGSGFESDDPRIAMFVARRLSTRVLGFTHHGVVGVDALNARIAHALDQTHARGSFAFAGAPVLIDENDPVTGLMNGDVGVVVPVREEGRRPVLRAAFVLDGAPRLFSLSRLPRARLAYATTVHKAQGTECDRVVVALPSDGPLLTRETFYTAITRARRSVWILGATEEVRRALERSMVRASRLTERVAAASISARV